MEFVSTQANQFRAGLPDTTRSGGKTPEASAQSLNDLLRVLELNHREDAAQLLSSSQPTQLNNSEFFATGSGYNECAGKSVFHASNRLGSDSPVSRDAW